ncbi:MAG: hypothetical protein WBO21_13695, partial [Acidimicrobiia bacterium]
SEAFCGIYALNTAGIEFVLDEATNADPDQGTAYTTIDGFSIQAGLRRTDSRRCDRRVKTVTMGVGFP